MHNFVFIEIMSVGVNLFILYYIEGSILYYHQQEFYCIAQSVM